MRIRFTKSALLGLAPPASGRTYVHDTKQANLSMCITAGGSKTFYRIGRESGKPTRYRIGRFPDDLSVEQARKECQQINGRIARGESPHAERKQKRTEQTLRGLFEHWIDYAADRKKSWQDDQRQYRKYLAGWSDRQLSSITEGDVQQLINRIGKEHGHYTANRLLALIRAMFNRASKIGFRGANPAVGVTGFPEESRDRFLEEHEAPRFFAALDEEPQDYQDLFRLLLATGARKSNVCAMRWEDIRLDSAQWRIGTNKSGKPVWIPLTPMALEILKRRNQTNEGNGASPYVFPSRGKDGYVLGYRQAWNRIKERSGLNDLRIHDLRRTLGSWMATGGASELVIAKALGHQSTASTKVYARLMANPVSEAMDKATAGIFGQQDGGEK